MNDTTSKNERKFDLQEVKPVFQYLVGMKAAESVTVQTNIHELLDYVDRHDMMFELQSLYDVELSQDLIEKCVTVQDTLDLCKRASIETSKMKKETSWLKRLLGALSLSA
jgi:acyl carrier protein